MASANDTQALSPLFPTSSGDLAKSHGTRADAGLEIRGRQAGPDLALVPIHQVQIHHRLTFGEPSTSRDPVRVRVLIDDDGVPFQATVISGPAFLAQDALKAARE